MADKLAVIQSEITIRELEAIESKTNELISSFKSLVSTTDTVNKAFQTGKPKDYANALNQLQQLSKEYAKIEKELADAKLRLAKAETQQAKTITEQNKARKEAANADNAEVRASKAKQKQLDATAGAYKRLSQEGNKAKIQAKNLEAEILLLTRDFKTGVISQEKYNQELAKLQGQFSGVINKAKLLDAQLKRIDASVGDRQRNVGNYQQAAMSSLAGLDRQIKSMMTMYLGFHAVVSGLTKVMHSNYELSDVMVDLQIRLKGNKQAADDLLESLRKLDTRTTLGELVNTAAIVAKKGVAKEEIEGITKALDDYFIVAGKEAGNREEGTASIIKLISIFNEDKKITADRVTEIGTALVKLQNSGVATGSKMIDVAERIGAIRGITGVTLPQVLGFAAAIEQLGQRSEVAGTAGMQILTRVLSNMPKYAKMANVSIEELRKAYSTDPFEAVVMIAEGVLKTGDFEKISQDLEEVGVKGARVKGVLGDIASNANFVRKRIKEAGLAINESGYLAEMAGLKQETYAAIIDKIGKEFELVGNSKGFINFLKTSSEILLGFIRILTAIPFGVAIAGLTILTAAWAYYKGAVVQATIAKSWNNTQSLLGIVRNRAARLGLLGEAEAVRAHTIATQTNTVAKNLNIASLESQIAAERAAIIALESKIVANEAEAVATRQQIAAKEAHIIALEAEVVATNHATIATKGLNTATKASPLGIVLGLLALAIPLLMSFTEKTEKAAIKVRALKENQEDLNKALDKGIKNAAEEVSHLDELYRKYTDVNTPMKEKVKIMKEWKDQYPSYFSGIKNEIGLTNQLASSYLELREAIKAASRADAIRDNLKGRESERLTRDEQLRRDINEETELYKKLKADANARKTTTRRQDGMTVVIDNSDLMIASQKRLFNLVKIEKNNRNADEKEDKILNDELIRQDKITEKLRNDRANRLGKFATFKEKKEKKYTGAKLSGEQKDYLNTLQAERDNEIAIQKGRKLNLEIDEKTYWENYIKIIQKYRSKIEAYLKGSNAKEKQIAASVRRRAVEELEKANKEIYDYDRNNLEQTYKMKSKFLERESKNLEQFDYLSNVERVSRQIDIDSKLIEQAGKYYSEQIQLAKRNAESTIEWERKRDEEIGKYQDSRALKSASLADALQRDIEKQAEFNKTLQGLTYEQQRAAILANKKVEIAEREYQLNVLDKNNQIEKNNLEIKRLEALKLQIKSRIALAQLQGLINAEDVKKLQEVQLSIEELKNENAVINIELKTTYNSKTQGIRDAIIDGLNDLGLDRVATQFSGMFDKIMDKTANWKDYTLLATSAVLQGLSTLADEGKRKRIAALDEELRKSQDNTDLETKFITSRIDMLNGLDEMSREQITERSRLENQARALREQQQQRERLIAVQKAKAEQRAAAQQAIINGLLAGTASLAKLGVPAGLIPAAIATGMGLANAALIMSRDPIPQYFVGRENGPAEWAWTQEKGREIITDKSGKIKSLGSDNGPQMTWLNKDDKVYTASKSVELLKNMDKAPGFGQKVYRNAAMSLISPVIINERRQDNLQKIAEEVGRHVEQVFKKYDKPRIIRKKGKIIEYRSANTPVIIGTYDLKTKEERYYEDSSN